MQSIPQHTEEQKNGFQANQLPRAQHECRTSSTVSAAFNASLNPMHNLTITIYLFPLSVHTEVSTVQISTCKDVYVMWAKHGLHTSWTAFIIGLTWNRCNRCFTHTGLLCIQFRDIGHYRSMKCPDSVVVRSRRFGGNCMSGCGISDNFDCHNCPIHRIKTAVGCHSCCNRQHGMDVACLQDGSNSYRIGGLHDLRM